MEIVFYDANGNETVEPVVGDFSSDGSGEDQQWRAVGETHTPTTADWRCETWTLAEVKDWPETKTVMEQRCVHLPWCDDACTDVPVPYTRRCRKRLDADVCLKKVHGDDIWKAVKKCLFQVWPLAVAGSFWRPLQGEPGHLSSEILAKLLKCLGEEGIKIGADSIKVTVVPRTKCGRWSPV